MPLFKVCILDRYWFILFFLLRGRRFLKVLDLNTTALNQATTGCKSHWQEQKNSLEAVSTESNARCECLSSLKMKSHRMRQWLKLRSMFGCSPLPVNILLTLQGRMNCTCYHGQALWSWAPQANLELQLAVQPRTSTLKCKIPFLISFISLWEMRYHSDSPTAAFTGLIQQLFFHFMNAHTLPAASQLYDQRN